MEKGKLVLATGEVFEGFLCGRNVRARAGEVVFSTGLTGYQEMLTDPSYCEQILVCTTPHIGNVGVNPWDMESDRVQVAGLVAQSICRVPSSWRSHGPLDQWMDDAEVPVLTGIETRQLTLLLRDRGVVKGWIGPSGTPTADVVRRLSDIPDMAGRNLMTQVSCKKPYSWSEGSVDLFNNKLKAPQAAKAGRVAVIDFGIKKSILRSLVDAGLKVTVFPALSSAKDLLHDKPSGIFLSNGPGDPSSCPEAVETIRSLLGQKPIFGICMGHQLLSLALGARTFKMPFGHRGINHPVKNLRTGHVEITSQNHGFAVEGNSLAEDMECTHISLNDNTIEGVASPRKKAFSVQYHPESFPGPRDSRYLFQNFVESLHE